jgi:hypothetical protein
VSTTQTTPAERIMCQNTWPSPAPEYREVRVGTATWRVRPGSIGEAMAVYAARVADTEPAQGDLDQWATDGGGMYAAGVQ